MEKIKNLLFKNVEELFTATLDKAEAKFELNQEKTLHLSDENFNKIIEIFDNNLIEAYSSIYLIDYNEFISRKNYNENKISELNKEYFEYYFSYLNTMHIVLNKIKETDQQIDINIGTIISIYAYALRLADEIGILLLNGYDDGALRSWRSLYEYCIIGSILISEKNDILTQRYIDYGIKTKKDKIKSYNQFREKLKFQNLDQNSIKIVMSRYDSIKSKYGNDFFNDHGWANIIIKKKRIHLNDLANKVGLDDLNPYYKWSCETLHNNINFTHNFFENDIINISKITNQTYNSDSIIDPMQITLKSLHKLNFYFLELISLDEEFNLNIMLFEKIYNKLQKLIKQTEKNTN